MNEFQPSLFAPIAPITRTPSVKGATIQERFEQFHRLNPQVYQVLRSLALATKSQGVRRWSIKAAFEIARWQYALQTQGEDYKLNNDFHAHYARLLMEREPELQGFFETREIKTP